MITVAGPVTLSMNYDTKGNITQKSDVRSVFQYTHSSKPYALTGIETTTALVPQVLQEVSYTSFEQPSVITESPYQAAFLYNSEEQRAKMVVMQNTSTILTRWYPGSRYMKETAGSLTKEYTWIGGDAYTAPVVAVKSGTTTNWYYALRDQAAFLYNSDEQRAKMEVKQNTSTILTRWYPGSRYMKETAGSLTKEYTWIGGDAYTAPVVAVKSGTTTNWYYALRDHLGTITHLVWSTNNVAGEYSFDSWGRRRDRNDWTYNLVGEPELFAGRGFTGHEWLPWFNLYNMNGRFMTRLLAGF
jgi:hypothetical protein